jgi:energy-coupling factor transport system substrate-specific component
MSSVPLTRDRLWEVSSRTIVYAAIGAALYAVLGLFNFVLPGTQNVYIRPAYALVPFFGYAFGPIVGFFTGFVGNVAIDQITGYGAFTAWNWSIANGLAGLLAGIIPVALGVRFGSNKIVIAAIVAALSTIIGFIFVFTDIWVFGTAPITALTGSYIPVVIANVISSVILTPILVAVWGPIQEQIGR